MKRTDAMASKTASRRVLERIAHMEESDSLEMLWDTSHTAGSYNPLNVVEAI